MKVAIVGGGLVGALEACLLAQRNFQVTIFESRHDGRNEPTYYGRSINLAISHRGISALERLNFDHFVKENGIPMEARMIHKLSGKSSPIPYDPDGRCINSIERAHLNNFLLNKAEEQFQVKILFNHKLVDMNADRGELIFRVTSPPQPAEGNHNNTKGEQQETTDDIEMARYKFDLILGCDGARSSVRSLLARQSQLELRQSYIEHGYLELRIDPNSDGSYRMPPNYLHIWPRGEYMLIALPNKDASFTCTLFMPMKIFDKLKGPEAGLDFFRQNFPDSVDLIGPERIKATLLGVRASSLISIRCSPYHYKSRVALLGDSAHAMVPFYGQGMNCGFEDCLVLDELMDKHFGPGKAPPDTNSDPSTSSSIDHRHDNNNDQLMVMNLLAEYSERRCANGHSMCDLAMYNYIEMRHLVNTWSFAARKQLDNLLYRLFPTKWMPLYTMVTFSRLPVDECVRRRQQQDRIIAKSFKLAGSLTLASFVAMGIIRLKGSNILSG